MQFWGIFVTYDLPRDSHTARGTIIHDEILSTAFGVSRQLRLSVPLEQPKGWVHARPLEHLKVYLLLVLDIVEVVNLRVIFYRRDIIRRAHPLKHLPVVWVLLVHCLVGQLVYESVFVCGENFFLKNFGLLWRLANGDYGLVLYKWASTGLERLVDWSGFILLLILAR